jgi:DNA recombination protein RmuC
MAETQDSEAKKTYIRAFERDIREKIKQVTTRDYINPDEQTVDFVIMFIPNEMIFSFIYENMQDVWKEAMEKKVILTGPFNFSAVLRLIRQSYTNFKYQNNVREIIKEIKNFEVEFRKYNESFDKIGERIQSLSNQYDETGTTRTRQLFKVIDKIRIEEGHSENALETGTN